MCLFFFFNDTATTEIYTLSLHDALPISHGAHPHPHSQQARAGTARGRPADGRLGFSPLPAGPRGALAQRRDLPAGEAEHRRRARGAGGSGDGAPHSARPGAPGPGARSSDVARAGRARLRGVRPGCGAGGPKGRKHRGPEGGGVRCRGSVEPDRVRRARARYRSSRRGQARSAHRRRVARRRRRERVLCCRASAPDRLRRRPEPEVFADRPCRLAPASHYGSANRHTRAGLLVDASFRRVHGGLQGSPRMKAMRLWPAVLLGAASLLILGCGDRSPLGVPSQAPTPHSALIDGPLAPTGLLTCQPLPYDSATQTIGPEGGTIQIGAYSLVIPAGALAAPTMITAVVVSGPVNAVRFQPEGLQFEQTAYLTMSYANCDLLGSIAPKQIAYTTDALGILEYLLSADDLLAQRVTGELHHFSEYAIAW